VLVALFQRQYTYVLRTFDTSPSQAPLLALAIWLVRQRAHHSLSSV